ncbi:hypothetical protein Acsp05_15660 [Actinokineospora sp. NBRC 105648]|nr:hypothetical protein Acsp05_15660 [Actinokineospora sp. NBRC 105648]
MEKSIEGAGFPGHNHPQATRRRQALRYFLTPRVFSASRPQSWFLAGPKRVIDGVPSRVGGASVIVRQPLARLGTTSGSTKGWEQG